MADNNILISAGFDKQELDKQIKLFVNNFKASFRTSLKDLRKEMVAINFDQIKIKVSLDLSHAKKQVEDFQKTLKALGVELADATNSEKLTKPITNPVQKQFPRTGTQVDPQLFINQQTVDNLTKSLNNYREALRATGAQEQEIVKYTREYTNQIKQLQNIVTKMALEQERFDRKKTGLAGPTLGGNPLAMTEWVPSPAQIKQLELAGIKAEYLGKTLSGLKTEQAQLGIETDRVNQFMDSFGFKVGILGFGTGIFGAHIQRLSQAMFQFIDASAKATEPLERLQNLLIQDGAISPNKRSFILAELNRLSDYPGSNLEQTAKTFRSLQTLGLATADSLKLLEGLTKATARSGIGAEGLDRIAAQLRDFVGTGQLRQQEIRSIISAGGKDVSSIIQDVFGGSTTNINEAGPQVFIRALIDGLGKLPTPLETATDKINKLRNSFTRMRLEIQQLITPGLDAMLQYLVRIEAIVKNLGDRFRQLPEDQKKWISTALVSLPVIGTVLAGVLTTLAAIAIGIATAKQYVDAFTISVTALHKATGPLATALKSVLGVGSGAGAIGGAARLLSLTNPIGIAIQLLVAYATNFGKLRDSVNRGAADMISAFVNLTDALTKFSSTKIGGAIIATLTSIYDLLEGITGIAGEALGLVLSTLAALINVIADLSNAFSADTFTQFLTRVGDAVGNFALRISQAAFRLVMSVVRGLVKFVGNIMESFSLLNKGFTEKTLTQIDGFTDKMSSRNLVVENGVIVDKKFGDSQKNLVDDLGNTTEAVNLQTQAFQRLLEAAEGARQKIQAGVIKASIDNLTADIEAIRNTMQTQASDFRASLDTIFDPALVASKLNELQDLLEAKSQEFNALNKRIVDENVKTLASSYQFDEFLKAAKASADTIALQDARIPLLQGLVTLADAKTLDQFERGLRIYQEGLQTAAKWGAVRSDIMKELRLVETQLTTDLTNLRTQGQRDVESFNKTLSDLRRGVQEAAETRSQQLRDQRADFEAKADLAQLDEQIAAKQLAISKLREQTEKFELTATEERKRRLLLEQDIANLVAQRDIEKLQRDLAKVDPSDTVGVASINAQIVERQRELNQALNNLRVDAAAAQKDADTKALDARNARYKNAAQDLLNILKPFEEQLTRVLALGMLDTDQAKKKSAFTQLADDLSLVGGSLKEVQVVIQQLRSGAATKDIVESLFGLQKAPIQTELSAKTVDLQNKIQALILSAKSAGRGNLPGGLMSILGISDDTPDALIKSTLSKLTDLSKIQAILEQFSASDAQAEVEDALALLLQAKNLEAEIQNINLNGTKELMLKITEAVKNEQLSVLDSEIKELEARLETSRLNDAQRAVGIEGKKQNELIRKIISFNARKESLEAQYRALSLAAETKDAEAKKLIFTNLQNELIAIRKKALQQMLDETGEAEAIPGDKAVSPTGEGANIKQPSAENTPEKPLYRISDALYSIYENARQARGALTDFFDQIATGQYVLDAFQGLMTGATSAMDVFTEFGKFAVGAFASAFTSAFTEMLTSGGSFLEGFGKFLGDLLIMLGQALLQMGIAAMAVSLIRFLFGDVTAPAMGLKAAAFAAAAGAGLIALGSAIGGGSKAAKTSSTNTSNNTNATTGARGSDFDPDRDPRTVYQKALMAQIQIDIRTDDTQIVKTVIKHVNQNTRLTKLIGNRKLQFGY